MANADYIDHLAAAGVPLRVLVSFGVHNLDWLGTNVRRTFRVVYRDGSGQDIREDVGAAGLLMRAHALGWVPLVAEQALTGEDFLCFEEANHFCHRGVHWYSAECDEVTGLPLALPSATLAAARSRWSRAVATRMRKFAAKERAAAKDWARESRARHAQLLAELAAEDMRRCGAQGKPISQRTAVRRARRLWADMVRTAAQLSAIGKAKAVQP